MERDLHQSNTARDREEDAPEPPQIRRFRRLVSFTMVTMMIGMLGIMGALVWKLIQSPATVTQSVMRGNLEIPAGFDLIAVSRSQSSLFLILRRTETGERRLLERNTETNQLVGRYDLLEIEP